MHGRSWNYVALVFVLAAGAGCRKQEAAVAAPTPAPQPAKTSAPFEVGAVIRQVRHAFRAEGDAWRGGYQKFDAKVTAQGIELRPFHYPVQAPSEVKKRGESPEPVRVVEGAPFRLAPVRVQRGGVAVPLGAGTFKQQEDGSLKLVRAVASEHLVNSEDGVEQSWEFASAPRGSGDLVVTVPVSGLEYVGRTEDGEHFVDLQTGLGFRYGHGTWIDAAGRRTALPVRFEEGALSMLVRDETLRLSQFPAVLDPVISPEFGMDQPVVGRSLGEEWEPSIAGNGSGYLVAWGDTRSGSEQKVIATRVSSTGVVLDGVGIALAGGNGVQMSPAVSSNGSDYLVVWQQHDPSTFDSDVLGTRVSASGVVLDTPPLVIAAGSSRQQTPAIASNGAGYLVVWLVGIGAADVFAARVSPAGVVEDAGGIAVSVRNSHEFNPSVASVGSDYLVVWIDTRNGQDDIYGARVSGGGQVLDANGIAICSQATAHQRDPSIASNGSNYFVAWMDRRNGAEDIYGTRVSAAGSVLEPAGLALSVATGIQQTPAVAGLGADYLIVWSDQRSGTAADIYGNRVTAAGVVRDGSGFTISTAAAVQEQPSVTSNGTEFMVAWTDARTGGGRDIYAARVTAAAAILDPAGLSVSRGPTRQSEPTVGTNGSGFLVAWADFRNPAASDIYAVRVNLSGQVLDPAGIVVSNAPNSQWEPAIASAGADYFVVWSDFRNGTNLDLFGTRLTGAGVVLEPAGIAISTAVRDQRAPSIASNGTGHYVVWSDSRATGIDDVYGTRVSLGGVVSDPAGAPVSVGIGHQRDPAIATNGSDYYVVWSDTRNTSSAIYGSRISSTGVVQDSAGVPVSAGTGNRSAPALAGNAGGYFAVWQDTRRSPSCCPGNEVDVYGSRISNAGAVLDVGGIAVSAAPQRQEQLTITSDGSDFLVAWLDYRALKSDSDIFGTRVSSAGVVMDGSGFAIAGTTSVDRVPALSSSGVGRYFIVYEGFDPAPQAQGMRVVGRFVTFNEAPVASAVSVSTSEDTPRVITLTATDAESDPLSFSIVAGPTSGSLSGTPPNVVYTPAPNFHGADSFTFRANDGSSPSNVATVSITITPVNDGPTVTPQTRSTSEDTALAVALAGLDVDGDTITFTVTSGPAQGALSGTPPNVTYTPAPNFHGTDSFSFTVSDGTETSAPATVSLTVTSVNDAPFAAGATVSTPEDTPTSITLAAVDPDGDPLTYRLVAGPSNGSLSGTPPHLAYTPASNSFGGDSFTFIANDGTVDSNVATIAISVTAVNDAPTAIAQALSPTEDAALLITLSGVDPDGDTLTFVVVGTPAHGTLSGSPPNVTYTPNANYFGSDSFTFEVDDGTTDSLPATVSLAVTSVNDAPVANAATVSTVEDAALTITLTGSDVDADTLSLQIVNGPAHGALSGTPPNLTYTPEPDYQGGDGFTFRANDGAADSTTTSVTISVAAVNDAPVATAQSLSSAEETALAVALTGSDADGDTLSFVVVATPAHGTLSGTPPNLTYTPNADYSGPDSFTFTASDGTTDSAVATVRLTVTSVNDAPVATAQTLNTSEDAPRAVTLSGSDVDGDTLGFTVVLQPTHGTLSGTAPSLTYTPHQNYLGPDSFTFKANDGTVDSSAATVTLDITAVNDVPVAAAQSKTTAEDTAVAVTLSARDADADTLSFTVATQPGHGTLSGTAPNLTYTPEADFHGADSFTFTASDGAASSTPATVSLTVTAVNDAPVAVSQSLTTPQGSSSSFTLSGTDGDGDTLSFTVVTPPSTGTLTGTGPSLIWEPPQGFRGQATLVFRASDGTLDSADGSITITVSNGAPTVTIAADSLQPLEGNAVHFTATAADPGGDTLTFAWDFGGGGASTDVEPSHVFEDEGSYTVVVTVSDGVETGTASLVVEVQNGAPLLVPATVAVTGDEAQELTFTVDVTDPGMKDSVSVSWDFADGSPPVTGTTVKHVFKDDGRYTVTVTATDNAGAVTTGTRDVAISNVAPSPHQAATLKVVAGERAEAMLSAVDPAGENDPLTWSLVEGDGSIETAGHYAWDTTAADVGTHVIKARVADDDSGSAETVFSIEVEAPPQMAGGCGCTSGGELGALGLMAAALFRRRRSMVV